MAKKIFSSILLIINFACFSQIVYVKQNATGLNNGTSWQDAYTDLSTAINTTSIEAEIWVAAGVYLPTTNINGVIPGNPQEKSFRLKSNLAIYGGFNGTETLRSQRNWSTNQVTLSGAFGGNNGNALHVISCVNETFGRNTVLDGLKITGGYANGTNSLSSGSAIDINNANDSSFTLANCTITFNATHGSGAVSLFRCNGIIENNIFSYNQAFTGGALSLSRSSPLITNNVFDSNTADNFPQLSASALYGGALNVGYNSGPKILNNIFKENYAKFRGGAITFDSSYPVEFSNNLIANNESRDGGGIYISSNSGYYYFFNNLISKNTANNFGGGLYIENNLRQNYFVNNTIVQNSAQNGGGGLYIYNSKLTFANTIFYNNATNISPNGAQIRMAINTSLLTNFNHCNIQGGLPAIWQNGPAQGYQDNLDTPPLFTDDSNYYGFLNNYRLLLQSPLIDAGTTDSNVFPQNWTHPDYGYTVDFPTTDYDGNPRVRGIIDIGAFENQASLGIAEQQQTVIKTYPNPVKDYLYFDTENPVDKIEITDYVGRKIETIEPHAKYVDLGHLKSGMYFILLYFDTKSVITKIIKE
ncbi:MAG: choice-of-anchor Q domain-containing protein [Flavobacterium sp.]